MRWILALVLVGCASPTAAPPPPLEAVRTAHYPLAWMAERIAGDAVLVELVLPPGADPARWDPDDAAIDRMHRARLVLINGAGFEAWTAWVSLPLSRVVDTAHGFRHRWLRARATHQHGPEGPRHGGIDGHTWLDPRNARRQAAAIHGALVRAVPGHDFDARFLALTADLDALDQRLQALQPGPMATNHPAYGYLARRYGWRLHDFDLAPDAVHPAEALDAVCATGATLMLWESEPRPATTEALRSRCGMRGVVFAPGESKPDSGDYLDLMRANLDRLAAAISRPGPSVPPRGRPRADPSSPRRP